MMIKRKMGYFRAVNFFQIAIDARDRTFMLNQNKHWFV
jgi:hypothetical protein